MDFAGLSLIAIIAAALAGFAAGGAYYGLVGKEWMAAAGLSEADIKPGGADGKRGSPVPFILALLANLVMAFVLAGSIGHLGLDQVTLKNGIISAAILWAGFVLTTISVNYAFQMRPLRLIAIDAGHWLLVLLVQGAVIGVIGL